VGLVGWWGGRVAEKGGGDPAWLRYVVDRSQMTPFSG